MERGVWVESGIYLSLFDVNDEFLKDIASWYLCMYICQFEEEGVLGNDSDYDTGEYNLDGNIYSLRCMFNYWFVSGRIRETLDPKVL